MRTSWIAPLAIFLSLSASPPARQAETASPPNVVFLLVDDLGWRDTGCYGSSFYETPRIDGLAASGMLFTQAYAACPVCSPTRASLLTGRSPIATGITDYINPGGGNQPEKWGRGTELLPASYADHLAKDEVTLAEVFRAAGYATFFAGKWHLGGEGFLPTDQGFDVNCGGLDRGGPYGGKKYFSPYGNAHLEDGPEGEHLPDRLARETVAFIEEHKHQPFFAYLSFYSVHTPLMAREDLRAKYERKREGLPERGDDERWGREGARKSRLVQDHAVYAGMVEAMDSAIGVVLDGLSEMNLLENTIIIFTSDNGGLSTSEGHPTSNLPLRAGKGWLYEGGIREPLIVSLPGVVRPGSTCTEPVTSVDFFPSLLELTGLADVEAPASEGQSFAPLLRGESREESAALFWHYPHYGNQGGSPGAAIRAGAWKLIEFFEDDSVELYDLDADPAEARELSAAEPEKAAELRERLDEWQLRGGAKFPTVRVSSK